MSDDPYIASILSYALISIYDVFEKETKDFRRKEVTLDTTVIQLSDKSATCGKLRYVYKI